MKIDHINLRGSATLLQELRCFYCDLLGLEEGPRPDFGSRGHWLYSGDRPIVHLSVAAGDSPQPGFTHLDHVAFQAAGLAEFTNRLERSGVAYRRHFIPELAMTQLFLEDPAGTGIEVNFPGEGGE
jgi:catechol-2,3-dioxygenase